MTHALEPQWEWFKTLPQGTRVVAHNGTWIRARSSSGHDTFGVWVNVETGDSCHFSHLASLDTPPRIECRPSPFA